MTYPDQVTNPGRERIESIQILRCLAATLVVLYHTDLQVFRLSGGQHTHAFNFAAACTDLLFVISGFIMVHIAHGRRVGFGEFIFRRLARIAPLYWLLTLLMLAAYLVLPRLFNTTAFDLWHFLASLAFMPYPHPVLGVQQPFPSLAGRSTISYFSMPCSARSFSYPRRDGSQRRNNSLRTYGIVAVVLRR